MPSRYRSRYIVAAILACALLAGAVGALIYYRSGPGPAAPAAPAGPQRVSVVKGTTYVTLDSATQRQSGLAVEALVASERRAETLAYGTVLDLQPLADLRSRAAMARADADTARAALAAAKAEFERARTLYQDDRNASRKAFETAQAAYLGERTRLDAAERSLDSVRASARLQFGERLAVWALDGQSRQFDRLLARQDVLLRVTLPSAQALPAPAAIEVVGNRAERFSAELVSASPQADPALQGEVYLYRSAAPFAAGANVVAYLPAAGAGQRGVLVPGRAIVWHGGQPWAYVQTSPNRFARRPVAQQLPVDGGFLVAQGLTAGDPVVVSGAQLLLSEELRPPPSSPGCKDPECD